MAIQAWKILTQRVVFEHPRLTLVEDTVALPNGSTTTYLKHRRTGHAATVIALDNAGRILLQREYSHPPAEVLYQFPGGGVPDGEEIAEGANRELMEECGLRGELRLIGSYLNDNRRTDAKTFVFVATKLQAASLPADAEEFIENSWHTEAAIDDLIAKGELKQAYALATWAVFKNWRSQ